MVFFIPPQDWRHSLGQPDCTVNANDNTLHTFARRNTSSTLETASAASAHLAANSPLPPATTFFFFAAAAAFPSSPFTVADGTGFAGSPGSGPGPLSNPPLLLPLKEGRGENGSRRRRWGRGGGATESRKAFSPSQSAADRFARQLWWKENEERERETYRTRWEGATTVD